MFCDYTEHLFTDFVKGRPVSARTPHQRGDGERLRGELIDAASALLLAARPSAAPSLRAIARECGVAPSAVYRHFPSQEALLMAVVEVHFAHLRAALDAVHDAAAEPGSQLRAMARAYVGWAMAHPGAYQLLFERPDPEGPPGTGPGLDLLDRVARALPGEDPDRRALQLWSAMHGVASLRIHKARAPWVGTADGDIDAVVAALVR